MGESASAKRLYFLDACRGAFMLLGIVLHAAIPFTDLPWDIKAPSQSTILAYVYHFIHIFRMPGFFVIAGYFAALGLTRRPTSRYMGSRFERLGVPLLFGILFIIPLQAFALGLPAFLASPDMTLADFAREAVKRHAKLDFHLVSHLWFILDLLIMSLMLAAVHALDQRGLIGRAGRWAANVLAARPASVGLLLLLSVSASLRAVEFLAYSPVGSYLMAFGTYPMWMIFDAWRLLYYAPFFLLGIWLFGAPMLFERFVRPSAWIWPSGAACVLFLVTVKVHRPDWTWATAALAAPSAILATRMWMHAALLLLDRPNRLVQSAADGAYTMYIVHQPIVYFATVAVIYWKLDAVSGFPLVFAIASTVSVAIYLATRDVPLARYLLSGIRPLPPRRTRTGVVNSSAA